MAGKHRDPLRHLVWLIWTGCFLVGVIVIFCNSQGIPSEGFWGR